ncbi:probable peroxisome biogenesis factor 1 [Coccomyxa sp. Obi]|nr:probable peroxisome biogenesis factor 1 [Coccomyxa sp. Obi]
MLDRLNQLPVRLVPERSCWVALPPAYVARLLDAQSPIPLVLQLSPVQGRAGAPVCHVAWAGAAASSHALEMPAALARCLGLSDGALVALRALPEVPLASSVSVEPADADDWEQVELNAEYMEEQLLNQVGVVSVGQPFPFWVRGQSVLTLRVATARPEPVVRLALGAEVSVAPCPRVRPQVAAAAEGASVDAQPSAPSAPAAWLRLQEDESLPVKMRNVEDAVPSGATLSDSIWDISTWQTTVAHMSAANAAAAGFPDGSLIRLHGGPGSRGSSAVATVEVDDRVSPAHVQVSQAMLQTLGLQAHRRVALRPCTPSQPPQPPSAVLLHPVGEPDTADADAVSLRQLSPRQLQLLFAAWLQAQSSRGSHSKSISDAMEQVSLNSSSAEHSSEGARSAMPGLQNAGPAEQAVALQDGTAMRLGFASQRQQPAAFFIKLRWPPGVPRPPGPVLMQPSQFLQLGVSVELGKAVALPLVSTAHPAAAAANLQKGGKAATVGFGEKWLAEFVRPTMERLLPLLHHTSRRLLWTADAPPPGGLLVCGPAGSGKTALVRACAQALGRHPLCRTHVVWVNCRDVETETLAKAKSCLLPLLREAAECMPSLLVLDDLELLCPAPNESPDTAAATAGSAALVAWLRAALREYHARPGGRPPMPVVVCATCTSAAEVAGELRAPGLLDHTITLRAPAAEDRAALMSSGLQSRGVVFDAAHVQTFAGKLEGYDAADIRVLLDRAMHAALRRNIASNAPHEGKLEVGPEDMEAALQGFSPASAWGVGRVVPGEGPGPRGWADVGGLEDVRDALRETLELPTRYAKLIARAPLRLRTGVLLYGPPGCGKTHIVAAAVAAAGVRFVSVKGPEVLNKYIGASEAAVRDLFRRASVAAPCVLFFDEFDAIAPQRGHDSTGVTDRVVNQLLTELDGVEGLKGVVVIGATSRPDMLDAALLRPGRLDRLLYCGFPTTRERTQILRALSSRLPLEDGIDLGAIAAACDGFSGADLGALLSDAQLAAVHAVLAQPHDTSQAQQVPLVRASHLRAAVAKARCSVPAAERDRLEAIYSKFR